MELACQGIGLTSRSENAAESMGWRKSKKGIVMADVPFGEDAPATFAKEVRSNGERVPGLGWEISQETYREIEDLETSTRIAQQRSGMVFPLD